MVGKDVLEELTTCLILLWKDFVFLNIAWLLLDSVDHSTDKKRQDLNCSLPPMHLANTPQESPKCFAALYQRILYKPTYYQSKNILQSWLNRSTNP